LNDANRIFFKRSEIALAKHSNNSHLYVKLIYIYSKKVWLIRTEFCW